MVLRARCDMANRILLGNNTFEFGIVGVADTFGTLSKLSIKTTVDEFVFEDHFGDALTVLLHNQVIEMTIECLYQSGKTTPTIGAQVDIPGGSLKGNITEINFDRGNKDGRKISFTAKHWVSMGNVTAQVIS